MKSYNLPMDSPLPHPPCVILLTFGLNKYNLFRINWFFFIYYLFRWEVQERTSSKTLLGSYECILKEVKFFEVYCKDFAHVLSLICLPLWNVQNCRCLFLCYGNVSTMWDILYLLMYAKLSFFPQDWDKKGFSYCESGKQLP